jgi:hypothetical protein
MREVCIGCIHQSLLSVPTEKSKILRLVVNRKSSPGQENKIYEETSMKKYCKAASGLIAPGSCSVNIATG